MTGRRGGHNKLPPSDGRHCLECGEWFPWINQETGEKNFWKTTSNSVGYRAKCKWCDNGKQRSRRHAIPTRRNKPRPTFICIYDPTGTGAWKGGGHSGLLMQETLEAGFFPPGLIFKSRIDGKKYKVVGEYYSFQRLVEI